MKIIARPDIHNQSKRITQIGSQLAEVDLVLLPGDLTNSGEVADAAKLIDMVQTHCPHVLAVTGNWDSQAIETYMMEQDINLHVTWRKAGDMNFVGLGGALPFLGRLEYSESDYRRFLAQIAEGLDPQKPFILVSHQPPFNTRNDRTSRGEHVGSHAIRAFIEEHQPLACFTGHIHEGIGVDAIGKTKIINPGMQRYAYVEISADSVDSIAIIDPTA